MEDLKTTKKAFVIGARETVRCFNLIGIPGKEVTDSGEAKELLEQVLKEQYSLIIISGSIASKIQDVIDNYRIESQTPITIISDLNTKIHKDDIEKKFRKFIGF